MAKKETNFSQFNKAGQKYIKKQKPPVPKITQHKPMTPRVTKSTGVAGGLPAQIRGRKLKLDKT